MIALHRTKHSDFVHSVPKAGEEINLAGNNFFILRELIQQSYDPKIAEVATSKWNTFAAFIKYNQLEVLKLSLGYVKQADTYFYFYTVQSKVHNTPAFLVFGDMEDLGIPFAFVPPLFATWLTTILNAVPFENLVEVAEGL
jgi:hypothetical protein